MKTAFVALPGNERLRDDLAARLTGDVVSVELRRFPDQETFVRVLEPVAGREVIIVAALDRPDDKFLPLAFLAATARDLGAVRVGLVAPYLAYMRQDRRFHGGEGVTSRYFAGLLSRAVDWLVTVDPHLHRVHRLADLYTIPACVVHAAPAIAAFIRAAYPSSLLVGPDEESEQWVAAVAADAGVPYVVLAKERAGDRDVRVRAPTLPKPTGAPPLILDDIVSTGYTMTATARALQAAGYAESVGIGVHAILGDDAVRAMASAGVVRLVTCNTIRHVTNGIDLTPELARAVDAARELAGSVSMRGGVSLTASPASPD